MRVPSFFSKSQGFQHLAIELFPRNGISNQSTSSTSEALRFNLPFRGIFSGLRTFEYVIFNMFKNLAIQVMSEEL